MTFPDVSDTNVNTSGDWEAFSTSFGQFHTLDAATANSSLNHVTLSPIAKQRQHQHQRQRQHQHQHQKQHSVITCMTPPKIVRKDADRMILLDHSDPATLETPTKNLLGASASAFAYDTPPHKKLFDNSDDEKENDTPKTCNTSNLSSSFVVNQISFDPNKTSSFVEDPEESFDTLFSSTSTDNQRRSYFDDSMEQESTTNPPTTPSTSILHQAEQVFLQQVDTLMEKFMWGCVQQEQEQESNTAAHGANPTNKKNKKTTSGNGSNNNNNSIKTKRVVQV
jgi:hypothetical protein